MNILVINCGSSTLKFKLVHYSNNQTGSARFNILASGIVDRIGGKGKTSFRVEGGQESLYEVHVSDHGEAIERVLSWIKECDQLGNIMLDAVGHRVVHGGKSFAEPAIINDNVLSKLDDIGRLAPLHNIPALRAIRRAQEVVGNNVPMVAVFDTSFHGGMPEYASTYAIPGELTEKYNIKRYGFHGIAHRYMMERYACISSLETEKTKIITLQLGNGCSAAAIKGGISIDTSMGFTPLEGLVMGTRCGDVDPSLAVFLSGNEGVEAGEVEQWMNSRSGLLGVSGKSADMRELLESEKKGDERAELAIQIFCYRIRKYIGSYLSVLGGADAVIFGGGIGENSPEIRERICAGMEWCGIMLDPEINSNTRGMENRITGPHSLISCYVIPVDEESVIAEDTVSALKKSPMA